VVSNSLTNTLFLNSSTFTLKAHNGHLHSVTKSTLCPNLNALNNLLFSIFMLSLYIPLCNMSFPCTTKTNVESFELHVQFKSLNSGSSHVALFVMIQHIYIYNHPKNRVEHRWLHYINSNAEYYSIHQKLYPTILAFMFKSSQKELAHSKTYTLILI